jgi:atypical dual specificity phosphatase
VPTPTPEKHLPNFGWLRPGRVAAMGCPHPRDWPLVAATGVRAVLSLTERAPPDLASLGIRSRHEPIADFAPPSPEALERCVTWIDEQVEAGCAVAVHCAAGLGRTGTILAAWLVKQGEDPDRAIAAVRRARPGSVETREQVEAVRAFARRAER